MYSNRFEAESAGERARKHALRVELPLPAEELLDRPLAQRPSEIGGAQGGVFGEVEPPARLEHLIIQGVADALKMAPP
ncbi:MAG: hypothetical protein UZ18_ATM001000704 [Armatimonadetes bacterium OLB18]|nr:MAG: hypothetical protein UZ18_ATM001000704 [Armatimonadetes bacterium OLB18]